MKKIKKLSKKFQPPYHIKTEAHVAST